MNYAARFTEQDIAEWLEMLSRATMADLERHERRRASAVRLGLITEEQLATIQQAIAARRTTLSRGKAA